MMREALRAIAIGVFLVSAVPATHARENVEGLLPPLDPMAAPLPELSESGHITGNPANPSSSLPLARDPAPGIPPCMRIAIRSIGNFAPLPVTFHHAVTLPPRFAYLLPREVSVIDRSGALVEPEPTTTVQHAAPDALDRLVQTFRDTPLARATLRYLITPQVATQQLAPFLFLDDHASLRHPLPADSTEHARLEVRPVWGSVRGALVRVVF
jgi:hypothetical protein